MVNSAASPTVPTPPKVPALPARLERHINLIVLHCSATPSGKAIGPLPAAVVDRWHGERKPPFMRNAAARQRFNPQLASIGYHFVIGLDGTVYTGRHPDEVGAHVAGHNANSLGICMVGGAEREARFTRPQWGSLVALVTALKKLCPPTTAVVGHRDLSPDTDGNGRVDPGEWLKTCPGFAVAAWLSRGMQPNEEQVCPTP
jgi:N-acetylmuramoyl-L-alanine amidase